MSTPATATYFIQSTYTASTGFGVGTLIDNDLTRGDDRGEAVNLAFGQTSGGGTRNFFTQNQEMRANVTFTDGSTLSEVNSLFSANVTYGLGDLFFLFDTAALAAVGKTVRDVARVDSFSPTDHSLNWTDFGFSGTPIAPVLPPPPPPPPVLTVTSGTAGNDRLVGTAGADLIRGGDGNDRLTGRAGEDSFVFGADARDGNRDRDVITDFNAEEDTIVFEAGVRIGFIEERGTSLFIQLEGGTDSITVLNADRGLVANFEFTNGLFLG